MVTNHWADNQLNSSGASPSCPISWDLPSHFRVPLTCYTCVTASSRARDSCSAGTPVAVSYHDSRTPHLRFNKLRVPGGDREGTGWFWVWGVRLIRVGRRREAAGVDGGWDHHRYRVWNLLGCRWCVRGAWDRARLVLWDRAEGGLLSLHRCGLLPGPHCDPPGRQSDRGKGEYSAFLGSIQLLLYKWVN